MDPPFYIGTICVTPQTTEREILFSVSEHGKYLFSLVPTPDGFRLSQLDQALDHSIDPSLVKFVSDSIESQYN